MSAHWREALDRWLAAGLIDEATASRVRAWELTHAAQAGRSRLAAIVFALGGLLLGAGILLFVAAHWDDLSPLARFLLVATLVGALHVGGAFASRRSTALAMTLHAVGTAALGAGIYLAGQIFNMAEHWPGALMLWALGAAAALFLLRDWPHVLWVALLVPAWLCGEWMETSTRTSQMRELVTVSGLMLLVFAYMAASGEGVQATWRRALTRLGTVALIPTAIALGVVADFRFGSTSHDADPSTGALVIGWIVAIGVPLAVAFWLRRREAVWMALAIVWTLLVGRLQWRSDAEEVALYAMFALGAAGVVMWGLRDQQRMHVNVGVLGFALAIFGFYFSSLFDKLGRSLGLIGLGVLFIGGGWLLERTRRQLIGRIESESSAA